MGRPTAYASPARDHQRLASAADPAPPAEIVLLIAAARVAAPRRQEVDRALATAPDWTRLIELALDHRLIIPLAAVLAAADPALVPGDVRDALRMLCDRLHEQSRRLVVELFALLDALDARAVTAIPFKGPLLAEQVFGSIAGRSPGDIDLLVHHRDMPTVRAVLEARDYVDGDQPPGVPPLSAVQRRLYERSQCEYQYVREADDMVVEPHWELSQPPLVVDVDYAGMLARARPATLGGRPVTVLAPDDLLLALCVHGAKHHWARLAWVRDVAGVLARWPELDLAAAVARARTFGCGRLLLLSLAIARDYGAATLPAGVEQAIDADAALVGLREDVAAHLFGRQRPDPWNDRVDPFRLRLRERRADRMRYALRTWLTPRRHHLEMARLPAVAAWAYYPLKLGTDFAVGPALGLVRRVIGRRSHLGSR